MRSLQADGQLRAASRASDSGVLSRVPLKLARPLTSQAVVTAMALGFFYVERKIKSRRIPDASRGVSV